MPRCASTKNLKSNDQCPHDALYGHTLCGKHRCVKVPRLWADVNKAAHLPVVRIQSLFRGWKIRRYIQLCGPGALRRKDCVNDEDLVTCIEKDRQYPFDYFGIEEAGKIWWFDFCTLWDWASRSIEPVNPYTKVVLPHDVKQRLKKVWIYRRRKAMQVPSEQSVPTSERIFRRWTLLCQVFRFYGFDDVHPNMFINLNKQNLEVMFRYLAKDFSEMPRTPLRALTYCSRGIQNNHHMTPNSYILTSLNAMMFMLMDSNAYDFIFLMLSALYRC
jgi:hypothetical protein